MSDVVISIQGLGKRFIVNELRQRGSLSHRLGEALAGFWRRRSPSVPLAQGIYDFWAVRNVSFDVRRSEVVGVIGRNGSGKSTLLKILARITPPTEGYGELHGRVGALLEIGTGFHPDLSGRENIFMNGAILGMSRRETARRFDEIVAFSEIADFLDTPVRHYSSGMFMRLAFAVSAHLDAEIMLIDEVLAVGDVGFQKKCLAKIRENVRGGRTALFISHDMTAIRDLSDWCILLDAGEIRSMGAPDDCIAAYEALFANPVARTTNPSSAL